VVVKYFASFFVLFFAGTIFLRKKGKREYRKFQFHVKINAVTVYYSMLS